jgi:exodeoxyribonuclease VII small subunit
MTQSKHDANESPSPTAEPSESATYKAMLSEVEELVREVGQPDLELDSMVSKIERGYTLIKAMRARLDLTKQKVEQLRLDFE